MSKQHKKFALIGTSCVGKTTLLLELEQVLQKTYHDKKIVVVQEAARYYFEKRKVNNPFSYISQSNIQSLVKKFEQNAQLQEPDMIICDRSVVDSIAYSQAKGTRKDVEKLYDKARKWLVTYDHFFLLDPAGIAYQTDEVRKESAETREAFHQSFLSLLEELMLPYTLISGNKKQRIKKMTEIIRPFLPYE